MSSGDRAMTDAAGGEVDLSAHPFALRRCAVCDYDLSGQPVPRRCPECGTAYDASALQVWGEAVIQSGWRASLGYLGFLGFLFMGPWQRAIAPYLPWIGAATVALLAWLWWRRREAKRRFRTEGGRTQLVIDRHGVARRNGPGPIEMIPWSRMPRFRLTRRYRWKLTRTRAVPASWYIFFGSPSAFEAMRRSRTEPFHSQQASAAGRICLDLLFDGPPEDAAALEHAIETLRSRALTAPGTPPDPDTT